MPPVRRLRFRFHVGSTEVRLRARTVPHTAEREVTASLLQHLDSARADVTRALGISPGSRGRPPCEGRAADLPDRARRSGLTKRHGARLRRRLYMSNRERPPRACSTVPRPWSNLSPANLHIERDSLSAEPDPAKGLRVDCSGRGHGDPRRQSEERYGPLPGHALHGDAQPGDHGRV